ncbi:MAG TPA: FtsX-like permease family protein [Steroidobacteraceae bacterium]|jgi:putative ABC transport system permease protein|nr:FtsX-like permease family protein [Steroidobacteraceae bacterium]
MDWGPIFSSIRRNKVGAALIALQVAVTLAVLCNALFIIQQRTVQSRRASGVADESSVFVITNHWVGHSGDLAARERADLTGLRSLPQVADASVSIDHPLGGPMMVMVITLHPDQPRSAVPAMVYLGDAHALTTLQLRLTAGRNFHSDEIVDRHGLGEHAASLGGVIVTRAVARKLSPDGNVLGRTAVIIPDGTTAPIIGVVDRLMSTPLAGNAPISEYSMLLPYRWADAQVFYLVRARPGRLAAAMTAARTKLYQISHQRVIMGMQTLTDARRDSYRGDRGLALIMSVVCAILLGITAFGIVGLTSYWVSQRRRQIGIRRALGATRGAILRYFQTENLLIAGAGAILGVALALAANLWVLRSIALTRLPLVYPLIGFIAMLVLGQLAVLWPALRAASVPPAVATRST